MLRESLLAAAVFAALLPARAAAEETTEISFHAGKMSLNMGKAAAGAATMPGAAYGFRILHDQTPFLGLGLDIDMLKPADKTSTSLIANGRTTTSVDSASVLGVVRLGPTEGDLRPNFLFGMGVHFTTIRLDASPSPGFGWADTGTTEKRTLIDSGGRGIAIKLQGGADYAFTDNFLAGGYLAWNSMGSAEYEATDAAKALGLKSLRGSMSAITFGVNLTGRF